MGPLFILGHPRSRTTAMAEGIHSLQRFGPYETEGHFIFLLAEPIDRIADRQLDTSSILLNTGVAEVFLSKKVARAAAAESLTASGAVEREIADRAAEELAHWTRLASAAHR